MNSDCSILLCINCMAYNHETYIRKCLEGFVMQKTNFKFVAIVHDDASNDKTAEIIREYETKFPEIIRPIFERENQYSKHDGSLDTIMNAAIDFTQAKYVALCDGDDYWTDPYKLQKQVDFLEGHENYSLCCHRYRIYNELSREWELDYVAGLFEEKPEGFSFTAKDNFYCWITKTMSLVYRRSNLPQGISKKYQYYRDVHISYHLLQSGLGYCMPDCMAVYRKQVGGVFSALNDKEKNRINLLVYHELANKNPYDKELDDFLRNQNDSYFQEFVRMPLYRHEFSLETISDIKVVVDGFKLWMGYKSIFYVLKKCLKSIYCGFRIKG